MRIADIQACRVEGFWGDWILVKVLTDEGVSGLGETFPTWAEQGTPNSIGFIDPFSKLKDEA